VSALVPAIKNKKFINGMGIHGSKEHCKDIAMTRYKKTPEVFNSGGFRIFKSLEMGLHVHSTHLFEYINFIFLV